MFFRIWEKKKDAAEEAAVWTSSQHPSVHYDDLMYFAAAVYGDECI